MATWKKVLTSGAVLSTDLIGSDGSANQVLKTDGSGTLSWVDQPTGDITGVTAGLGLTGGGNSGAVTINIGAGNLIDLQANQIDVDLGELTNTTATNLADRFAVISVDENGIPNGQYRIAPGDIDLSNFNNDSNFAANQTITAGTGLSGGGSGSSVSLAFDGTELSNHTIGDGNGTITISGNLTVTGTTTTVQAANLIVEDKNILLGNPDSAFADDAAAVTANTGGGISIVTDSASAGNYANFSWITGKSLTGWCAEDTQNDGKFEVAVVEFSTNSTAPTGDAAGVGSFHYDSGDDKLYIRTI